MRILIGAWLRQFQRAVADEIVDRLLAMKIAIRAKPVRGRLLVIDEMLPEPTLGAGYPRAAEVLRAVVDAGWSVTVYPLVATRAHYAAVRARFPSVRFLPTRGAAGLRRTIVGRARTFDAVLVSRAPVMACVADTIATPPAIPLPFLIYDAEATFTDRDTRRAALFGTPVPDADRIASLDREVAVANAADAVITVTQAEGDAFRTRIAATVRTVAHRADVREGPSGFAARGDFLFVGRSMGERHASPNVDSLIWFVDEVMPRLDDRLGIAWRLVIAGLSGDELVARLASSRVVFAGVVDDLSALYDRSRVFVAPTRYASGLPLKVVEAAAAGLPCVVTDVLAAQLGFHGGIDCMTASDADGFATGCATLYADAGVWQRVRDAASSRIAAAFSREAFDAAVGHVLDDIGGSRRARRGSR